MRWLLSMELRLWSYVTPPLSDSRVTWLTRCRLECYPALAWRAMQRTSDARAKCRDVPVAWLGLGLYLEGAFSCFVVFYYYYKIERILNVLAFRRKGAVGSAKDIESYRLQNAIPTKSTRL